MAALAPRYQYSPIDSAGGEIRLLTICSGTFNAPLDLRLDIRRRVLPQPGTGSPPTAPSFEALSYTWGAQSKPVNIQIGSCQERLSVTPNLATALPFLRLSDRDRLVWIDAVCIDQSNLQERGVQVQLMAEIFRQAAQVVCWVGLESANSKLAILSRDHVLLT
ncbi:uncharacterized protein GIQ15_03653 [Arthroderma uncinatum]|uniref:uncharacterized protein n=1 Tax=Arthroderma uncinatum TaxID=74035 RepID=UPI00144AF94C|nr:uncharacterized protein GIQ15_03653 [Arthroderma uncinatum]KAF3484329.1 hypothetical protein GIQ15_03653 [Arthroderma uncinatum]